MLFRVLCWVCVVTVCTTSMASEVDRLAAPPLTFEPASLLAWSAPDKGLVARIEHIELPKMDNGGAIFVRLMNTGEEPLRVPHGHVSTRAWAKCFELYLWDGQRWRPEFWQCYSHDNGLDDPPLRTLVLQPGESAITGVDARLPDAVFAASHIKLMLRLPYYEPSALKPAMTNHTLQTPAIPVWMPDEVHARCRAERELPTHLPFQPVTRDDYLGRRGLFGGLTPNPDRPPLQTLWRRQCDYFLLLDIYLASHVNARVEALMKADKVDMHWKLLLAMYLAENGSEAGKQVLLSHLDVLD